MSYALIQLEYTYRWYKKKRTPQTEIKTMFSTSVAVEVIAWGNSSFRNCAVQFHAGSHCVLPDNFSVSPCASSKPRQQRRRKNGRNATTYLGHLHNQQVRGPYIRSGMWTTLRGNVNWFKIGLCWSTEQRRSCSQWRPFVRVRNSILFSEKT